VPLQQSASESHVRSATVLGQAFGHMLASAQAPCPLVSSTQHPVAQSELSRQYSVQVALAPPKSTQTLPPGRLQQSPFWVQVSSSTLQVSVVLVAQVSFVPPTTLAAIHPNPAALLGPRLAPHVPSLRQHP
jgi:hypothetical protein